MANNSPTKKYLHNIQLVNSTVLDFTLEDKSGVGSTLPNSLYVDNNSIKFIASDGTEQTVQFSSSSTPVMDVLGQDWINPDTMEFNPAPVNTLFNNNIFTPQSTIFDVISLIVGKIEALEQMTLGDLQDVSVGQPDKGDVLVMVGNGQFATRSIKSLLQTNLADIDITDLKGVEQQGTTGVPHGASLTYDAVSKKYVPKKDTFEYEDLTGLNNVHNIQHDLNCELCRVDILNVDTNTMVPASSITVSIIDVNNIKVSIPYNYKIKAIVTAIRA